MQCYRLAYCDGSTSERKVVCVSIPHPYTAHITQSVVLWLQQTISFHMNSQLAEAQSQIDKEVASGHFMNVTKKANFKD